jgi:hypothetical protein
MSARESRSLQAREDVKWFWHYRKPQGCPVTAAVSAAGRAAAARSTRMRPGEADFPGALCSGDVPLVSVASAWTARSVCQSAALDPFKTLAAAAAGFAATLVCGASGGYPAAAASSNVGAGIGPRRVEHGTGSGWRAGRRGRGTWVIRGEVTVSVHVYGKSGGHVAAEALDMASFDIGLPGEWAIVGRGRGRYALVPVRGGGR